MKDEVRIADIRPWEIVPLLTEREGYQLPVRPTTGRVRVMCQEMNVAMVWCGRGEWTLTHVACSGVKHPPHPRFAKAYQRLNEAMAKLSSKCKEDECQHCMGTGWLRVDGAQQSVLMAVALRMFRGIELPVESLKEADLSDIERMEALLSCGRQSVGEVPSEPGPSASPPRGRADFLGKAKKGEEDEPTHEPEDPD